MIGSWPRATTIAILIAFAPATLRADRLPDPTPVEAEPPPGLPAGEPPIEALPPPTPPPPPPAPEPRREPRSRVKDIVVTTPGERSSTNITVLASLATLTLAAGALGLHYHMRSQRAADAVSATSFTGEAWSPAYETEYDKANRYRLRAGVLYGVGGALLIAAVVTFIVTAPDSETTIIRPRAGGLQLSPIPNGAIVGGGWSF